MREGEKRCCSLVTYAPVVKAVCFRLLLFSRHAGCITVYLSDRVDRNLVLAVRLLQEIRLTSITGLSREITVISRSA